jgi:hypothetical protein
VGDALTSDDEPPPEPTRPLVERIGLVLVAVVFASLFGAMGVVAWAGSEVFLAVMAWIGALMTLWAAASSVLRR